MKISLLNRFQWIAVDILLVLTVMPAAFFKNQMWIKCGFHMQDSSVCVFLAVDNWAPVWYPEKIFAGKYLYFTRKLDACDKQMLLHRSKTKLLFTISFLHAEKPENSARQWEEKFRGVVGLSGGNTNNSNVLEWNSLQEKYRILICWM